MEMEKAAGQMEAYFGKVRQADLTDFQVSPIQEILKGPNQDAEVALHRVLST
jgi:hypothetical protein